MSANTQTPGGESSKTSAERADTTSANTGRKRKTPVKASTLASKGGCDWDGDHQRTLWWMRHRLVEGGPADYESIGAVVGRTALACRGAMCKLRKVYKVKGYKGTFGVERPFGLGEPGENQPRKARRSRERSARVEPGEVEAADRAAEEEGRLLVEEQAAEDERWSREKAEDERLEKEAMEGPSQAQVLASMAVANAYLERLAHGEDKAQADQAAESMARGCAQFRGEDGRRLNNGGLENNKTTTFADPLTQARVECQRRLNARYFNPVPVGQDLDDLELRLDAAETLMRLSQGTGARPSPNPQFAAQRRTPQDSRMSIESVLNDD